MNHQYEIAGHKWMSQRIQKKFKNKHGNRRQRKKVDDESEEDVPNQTCYKNNGRVRDGIDYIKQYNDYTLMENNIQSQLDEIRIANIKTKWHCSICTFINSKNNLYCKMCNTPYGNSIDENECNERSNVDITLIDFMPTLKLSKKYAQKMQSENDDDALLQIATQLSIESENKRNQFLNYRMNKKDGNDKPINIAHDKIVIGMNNGEYGQLSANSKRLFYKFKFLQSMILPKLKFINKNSSDNYSKIKVEFIVKDMVLRRLNDIYQNNKLKDEMKLIYVNHKQLPLLNTMKSNVLFNENSDEYDDFSCDSLVKFSGIGQLIAGYLKSGTHCYSFIPTDIVNLIHLFCNLNPEQLLYRMDANANISYFKKRHAKINFVATSNDAIKMLHYNRTAATNKIYLCLLFKSKERQTRAIMDDIANYEDILPILAISKQVKRSKYYGSNNYAAWFTKRRNQVYPSYWEAEYANLFYQVEYQEYYGHI